MNPSMSFGEEYALRIFVAGILRPDSEFQDYRKTWFDPSERSLDMNNMRAL